MNRFNIAGWIVGVLDNTKNDCSIAPTTKSSVHEYTSAAL